MYTTIDRKSFRVLHVFCLEAWLLVKGAQSDGNTCHVLYRHVLCTMTCSVPSTSKDGDAGMPLGLGLRHVRYVYALLVDVSREQRQESIMLFHDLPRPSPPSWFCRHAATRSENRPRSDVLVRSPAAAAANTACHRLRCSKRHSPRFYCRLRPYQHRHNRSWATPTAHDRHRPTEACPPWGHGRRCMACGSAAEI